MVVQPRPLDLPADGDLDGWLAAREACVGDIVPGTEKKIFRAGQPGARTERSLVYIHGFSATRRETAPQAEVVAEKLGANLF